MEQIFMVEVLVKRVVLKIEPPNITASELEFLEEQRRQQEEQLALWGGGKKKKEKKKKKKKPKKKKKKKKGKKGKKKKAPKGPSEEELRFLESCTMQMNCLPVFDFTVAHDNFVAPPPPPPVKKGKKGKKGKKKKPKKKKKKGKKGKNKKAPPRVIKLPSEPIPQPPFMGVGNAVIFLSRPSKLKEVLEKTPLHISVWNRDQDMNCIGFVDVEWHKSFLECLDRSEQLNPVDMDVAQFRNTTTPEIMTNTVEMVQRLKCEENLLPSGEIEFLVKLSCLGNRVLSHFVALPEMERIPGRKYLVDDLKLKDVEVVRHWEGTAIESAPPVAYFYSAPDIMREPIKPEEERKVFEDYVAPFTRSELAILAMGFPKGPCGGTNCPRRMDYRGSQHQFIFGMTVKGKYQHGTFINERDMHGPCGRLDCPLAKRIRSYLCNEGAFKTCRKPCPKELY